ncbi:MAG TPA: hypothetical protein VME19_19825 [Streptosporangiaceae bacterium]|nr:hypothetical protein [Streptosporangiaceae bacterium]
MRKRLFPPNDPWCYPESPPSSGVADQDKCFPERVPAKDRDDQGCFPGSPSRGRRRPFDRLIPPR